MACPFHKNNKIIHLYAKDSHYRHIQPKLFFLMSAPAQDIFQFIIFGLKSMGAKNYTIFTAPDSVEIICENP